MNILKKTILIITLCIGAFVVEEPMTAFAKYIGSHVNRLQGNWGSSGIMDAPGIPFRVTDNPQYICQWQIYTNEKFINAQGLEFQKVSWAWFEINKDKTYFKSKDQKWTVAHVFSKPLDQSEPLSPEEKVDSQTSEESPIPGILSQTVYAGFIPTSYQDEDTAYKVKTYISLQQEVNGLSIGGSNYESASRDQKSFELHTRIELKRASNVRNSQSLHPLHSQLHCEKLN